MSILLVDDSPITLRHLRSLLVARGHDDVQLAESGADALALIAAYHPSLPAPLDVVVTDISMPALDGIELCLRMKANPHVCDVPVLMVTGQGDERTLEQAFAAGAQDFIAKPVNPADLVARVNAALRLKRELDRRRQRERELMTTTQELARVNKVLEQLATCDELTGIANRRAFTGMLDREWRRAQRMGLAVAVCMIDVDHFKGYNDLYGHLAGDRCLAHLAEAFRTQLHRPGDFLARIGGEEFVLLLPNTDAAGAQVVAENLCHTVAGRGLTHACSLSGKVTVSIGVATAVPQRNVSPESLLAAADEALYRAKAEGRNRVVMAPPAAQTMSPRSHRTTPGKPLSPSLRR